MAGGVPDLLGNGYVDEEKASPIILWMWRRKTSMRHSILWAQYKNIYNMAGFSLWASGQMV